jgi:tetratricopeptide (TPR) repeat protein
VKPPETSATKLPVFLGIRNDSSSTMIQECRYSFQERRFVTQTANCSVEAAADGWVRICLRADEGIAPGDQMAVYWGSSSGEIDVGHGYLIWGAQVNATDECLSYFPTRQAGVTLDSAPAESEIKPEETPQTPGTAQTTPRLTDAAPPAVLSAPPTPQQSGPIPSLRITQPERVSRLLYSTWLAELFVFTLDPDIPDEGYESVMELARRTAALQPDRRAAWDMALVLADQISTGKPERAAAVRREALANLARIDPSDDVVRLSRIGDVIDSHPTADARVRAYETILDPKNRASIGAPVASRLAYQLASLESRIGNTELFARWLGDAVKTDPSYPAAAQAAAGFFRMRVSDPAADVELLSIALEANPRDLGTWSALITVLLDGAAFKGAERVSRLAIAVAEGERRPETVYSFTGDLATALWGTGQREAALRQLDLRMGNLTEEYRRAVAYRDPTITLERLNREFPPLPSTLAIAMLGLRQATGNTSEVASLIDRAIRGSDAEIRRAERRGESDETIGALELQKATTVLLFGADVSGVPAMLDAAAKRGVVVGAAKVRFDAMLAWRQGKLDEALAALEPIRAEDPLARFVYGSALIEKKRTQEGAQELRALAQDAIGTSIGLLALDRLAQALGQDVLRTAQLSKEIGQRAEALEAALARSLPNTLDRMVENPMRALVVELKTNTSTVGPYEPLSFSMRLRNGSQLPLAIGPDAPVSGKIMLRTRVSRSGQTSTPDLPPQPLLIDRRLRLMPGEELKVDIDAELTTVGLFLNLAPLEAHALNVGVVTNPAPATGNMAPGFLGTVTNAPPLMSKGVAVTEPWLRESLDMVKAPTSADAVIRMALVAHACARAEGMPEAMRAEIATVWTTLADGWKALPAQARAWVLAVLPKDTPAMAPLLDAARADQSPEVLTTWLISRVVDPADPMLDVGRRSGDPTLAMFADATSWVLTRRAKRAVEEVGLEAGATPAP